MAPQPKVLFVLTSHDKLGDTGKPTGWYLPELAHPHEVLSPHTQITIASPKGGHAPLDPASVEATKEDPSSVNFLKNHEDLWKNTVKLDEILGHADDYEAIFYVGGHGPMFDLATSPVSQRLILEFHTSQKIISAVCHGPAAFVNVVLPSGEHFLACQRVTGFSSAEEQTMGYMGAMPFDLQKKLDEASGGGFEKAEKKFGVKVVTARGGRLVTGQNPASAKGTGEAVLRALKG